MYCLGLQTKYRSNVIFIHQSNYTEKILKCFNIDKTYPLSTPIVVWSLDPKKNPFRPKDDDEQILNYKVPYVNAIGALMYLTQCTRPDITFFVSLLARFCSEPAKPNQFLSLDLLNFYAKNCTSAAQVCYMQYSSRAN